MGSCRSRMRSNSCLVRINFMLKQMEKQFLYFLNKMIRDLHMGKKSVKAGYFPVLVMSKGGSKKLSIALSILQYPPFVELLEAAGREYGLDQPGVLVIPCEADELQRVLLRYVR